MAVVERSSGEEVHKREQALHGGRQLRAVHEALGGEVHGALGQQGRHVVLEVAALHHAAQLEGHALRGRRQGGGDARSLQHAVDQGAQQVVALLPAQLDLAAKRGLAFL